MGGEIAQIVLGDLKGPPNRPMVTLSPCPPKLNQRVKTFLYQFILKIRSKRPSFHRVEDVVTSTDLSATYIK